MAVYAMSDIHGNYELFKKMLEFINFTDDDELYIIGDIFDRMPNSYEVYKYIQEHSNIHPLMGNHELMAMTAIKINRYKEWRLWESLNQGITTMNSFIDNQIGGFEERKKKAIDEIYDYCLSLPLYKELYVNGQKFLLVHAGINPNYPIDEMDIMDVMWIRDEFYYYSTELKDTLIIFGHTPAINLPYSKSFDVWFDPKNKDKIGIDGGCFLPMGQLNCLRLDDFTTYSVKNTGEMAEGKIDVE